MKITTQEEANIAKKALGDWNAGKAKPFVPEHDEIFEYINAYGNVQQTPNDGNILNSYLIESGNCYRVGMGQDEVDKRNAARKVHNWATANGRGDFVKGENNWFVQYNHESASLLSDTRSYLEPIGVVAFFASEKLLNQCVAELADEWEKIMARVKNNALKIFFAEEVPVLIKEMQRLRM